MGRGTKRARRAKSKGKSGGRGASGAVTKPPPRAGGGAAESWVLHRFSADPGFNRVCTLAAVLMMPLLRNWSALMYDLRAEYGALPLGMEPHTLGYEPARLGTGPARLGPDPCCRCR